MMLDCGAFTTITPRRVASSTSTLSSPIPARATTFRLVAAASTSAVTCVALRMMSASYGRDLGGQVARREIGPDVDLEVLRQQLETLLGQAPR